MPRSSIDQPDTLADFVARHRALLGLSHNQLAQRTISLTSTVIYALEDGSQDHLAPRAAYNMIAALELDPWDADRFLRLCGLATVVDWQRAYRDLLEESGYPHELIDRTVRLHAETTRATRARRRRP